MGLDMYISKVKRVGGLKLEKILDTEDYVEYLDRPEKFKDCTFEQWCGKSEKNVVKSAVDAVRANMEYDEHPAFMEGIDDYKPSFKTVTKNIAYWRKANQIHNWFVQNIQNGNDDCKRYELDPDDLRQLLETVNKVMESCELVEGKDGKVIKDSSVARTLLPSCKGFFFGTTDYDEWYYLELEYTKETIEKILAETDFDNWIVYYGSSW